MGLDIRYPIGVLFVIIGAILSAYGLTGDSVDYRRSLGINVNLWWGAVLLVVGLLLLWIARANAQTSTRKS